MRGVLKAGAGLVALGVLAGALLLALVSLERARGQPAAQAPTPTASPLLLTSPAITPSPPLTITPSPRPLYPFTVEVPWQGPSPTPGPPPTPAATPTPLPATGGPYISEQEAIAIALKGARAMGQVDETVPPRTIFTTARNAVSIIGKPGPGVDSDREVWIVVVYGRFPLPSAPAPPPRKIVYTEAWALMDATTGNVGVVGLKNELR